MMCPVSPSPKMEPVRNRTGVVTARDVLDAYREFAEAFGKEFAAENGRALAYSLDLCIDRNTGTIRASRRSLAR
mgnify:CR=1 FL=1